MVRDHRARSRGPTVSLMQSLAKELHIAMIVPVYEVEQEGIYYNTAAVIAQRRRLSRQVSQDAHSPRRARILGEVLFPARQSRLSGLRSGFREDRRLHLLRPPFPRGRALPGLERRGDRLQPLRHGGRA